MNKFSLFLETMKNFKTVGTITFSSNYLVQKLIDPIDFERANCIIELGAGNGCITEALLAKMKPDSTLLAYEINEKFCDLLNGLDDNRLKVINDFAENMDKELDKLPYSSADYIVSSLPLVNFSNEGLQEITDCIATNLHSRGLYLQIQYSLISYRKFKHKFSGCKTRYVWRNIPPAYVIQCNKKASEIVLEKVS